MFCSLEGKAKCHTIALPYPRDCSLVDVAGAVSWSRLEPGRKQSCGLLMATHRCLALGTPSEDFEN
jgi:hypothetical protein